MKLFSTAALGTVLAALRYWQSNGLNRHIRVDDPYEDIATDGGELEALGPNEIDDLCERLNGHPMFVYPVKEDLEFVLVPVITVERWIKEVGELRLGHPAAVTIPACPAKVEMEQLLKMQLED